MADALTVSKCAYGEVNVTANDSDPEGNVPLTVIDALSANPAAFKGMPSVVSGSIVGFQARENGATGTDAVIYTVRDSLGAISTGTINITIRTSGLCFQAPTPKPLAPGGG